MEAPKTIKCPHCVKRYTSKQGMMRHIESYNKTKIGTTGIIDYGNKMFGSFVHENDDDGLAIFKTQF